MPNMVHTKYNTFTVVLIQNYNYQYITQWWWASKAMQIQKYFSFVGILHPGNVLHHKPIPGGGETSDWHSTVPPLSDLSPRGNTQNHCSYPCRKSDCVHCLKLCFVDNYHGGGYSTRTVSSSVKWLLTLSMVSAK